MMDEEEDSSSIQKGCSRIIQTMIVVRMTASVSVHLTDQILTA